MEPMNLALLLAGLLLLFFGGEALVRGAAALARRGERVGELHSLRALDREERLRDASVEAPIPLRRGPEPGDDAARA